MNPRTARSQYMGAMIWSISSALHEATETDRRNGRNVNDNLADYPVPVNADMQQLDVILMSEEDGNVNPLGIKGIRELSNVGTAATVANAVFHATGVRARELPVRLEKLLGRLRRSLSAINSKSELNDARPPACTDACRGWQEKRHLLNF
jgi:xanthine dehydrogenase YagR molybdenum-binding subunit